MGLFKISILLLYHRVFAVQWLQRTAKCCIWLIIGFTIALVIKDVLACNPIRKQWMPELLGSCINIQATYYVASAIFLLTDLVILILPQPLLWHPQMSQRQKLELTFVFGLGTL